MLFEKQKQSGRGKNYTTITFKLLKPQNTEALTKEKFANTEEKKKTAVRVQCCGPSHVVVWAVFLKGFLA